MGWFSKRTEEEELFRPDPTNPFSKDIEDEGEFITIVHKKAEDEEIKSDEERLVTVVHREVKEEQENGSTRDRRSIP